MNSFLEKVLDYKYQILLVIAVSVFIFLYFDASLFVHETAVIEVKDRCGLLPSGLGVEHTILDEGSCATQCLGVCDSRDFRKSDSEFEENLQGGCNTCVCTCS